jgi:bacillithiol system protein YtxJ
MNEIKSLEEWEQLKDQSQYGPIIIFKHSITCGISGDAFNKIKRADDKGEFPVPVHLVIVQESREISNRIAQELSVKHESPQVIVIRHGAAVYDASHFAIEVPDIVKACNG